MAKPKNFVLLNLGVEQSRHATLKGAKQSAHDLRLQPGEASIQKVAAEDNEPYLWSMKHVGDIATWTGPELLPEPERLPGQPA